MENRTATTARRIETVYGLSPAQAGFQHEHAYSCVAANAQTSKGIAVILSCQCGDVKFIPYPEGL